MEDDDDNLSFFDLCRESYSYTHKNLVKIF